MKVCIVTLIRTNNCGSYWQAKALGTALERLGHTVSYYDVHNRHAFSEYKAWMGMLLHQGRGEAALYGKARRSFRALRKSWIRTRKTDRIDCVVLGSDTIWNLASQSLSRNADILWGNAFEGIKVITYAGSVGNAPEELFADNERIAKAARKWSAVSVRDAYTKEIVSRLTPAEIIPVCDPTLLLTRKDYEQMTEKPRDADYIFLYLFRDLSAEQSDALQAFARENRLRLVRGVNGVSLKAADCSVENSPLLFLKHMLGARYVITDTYHGTVFSINLNKQFVSIDRGKKKVNDALRAFRFEDRLIAGGAPFIETLSAQILYSERMEAVERLRKRSWDYLRANV